MVRAYENVEVACGMPMMMKGELVEDIAPGIDELMIRQPLGVCATIAPFNFPGMIPFWYLPYALAAGNTYIIKPSEKVPMTMQFIFKLIEQVAFRREWSTWSTAQRKRWMAFSSTLPSAPSPLSARPMLPNTSMPRCRAWQTRPGAGRGEEPGHRAAGCRYGDGNQDHRRLGLWLRGQRCLAVSFAVTVAEARNTFTELICDAASTRVVGYGLDAGVQMGPVINAASQGRVEQLIGLGVQEGAGRPVDGRGASIKGYEGGYFVKPTILADVPRGSEISKTEIFGPVLSLMHVNTVDEAIELVNSGQYGNQASLFTSSGSAARKFSYEAEAGNIGINIGVAAPMAFFPFSGWKDSFFGDMHGQGMDAVEFFTQKKVVVERWPKEWTRKF
jgi:malonate-semialdehyde dehydrogenase (acetylating) / methylmalonate-semialdehyde dehydrogenase